MIIQIFDDNTYLIKIPNNTIDVYNKENLAKITEKIYKKITKKYQLNNLIILEFYLNKNYGTIIKWNHDEHIFDFDDEIEVKMTIHTDAPFLYQIDYFDIKKFHLEKENIYYYRNNFYLEIKNNISKKKYYTLLELSNLTYENSYHIIHEGIKLKI